MIPLYFYIRLGFFVYLMAPQTKGALVLYKNVVKPILEKNHQHLNGFINEVSSSANDVIADAKKSLNGGKTTTAGAAAAHEEPVVLDNRE